MKKSVLFDHFMQTGLLIFTIGSYLFTSVKLPQYGLIAALAAQIFWIYSSYRAWKEAGQIAIFINTLLTTAIITYGVVNYWVL